MENQVTECIEQFLLFADAAETIQAVSRRTLPMPVVRILKFTRPLSAILALLALKSWLFRLRVARSARDKLRAKLEICAAVAELILHSVRRGKVRMLASAFVWIAAILRVMLESSK